MTVPASAVLSALLLATGLAAFIAWVVYQLLPAKVYVRDRTIVKKHGRKVEYMPISDISAINYHYHAAVGFSAVWEFVDRNARSLVVDVEAKGVGAVLGALEKVLPGFALTEFKQKFDAGDVEDSIEVWKAA